MVVQCNLCGGENRCEPGEKIIICSFCGASLIVAEETRRIENLLLHHVRNDRMAEAALRSHLKEKERRLPGKIEINFSSIPFFMVEGEDSEITLLCAWGNWRHNKSTPYPPAGKYSYLEPDTANNNLLSDSIPPSGADRILHLPVYSISYEAGDWKGEAEVIGESWQVIAEELPPERVEIADLRFLAWPSVLFAAYYLVARIAPGLLARILGVSIAAFLFYCLYTIRERFRGY